MTRLILFLVLALFLVVVFVFVLYGMVLAVGFVSRSTQHGTGYKNVQTYVPRGQHRGRVLSKSNALFLLLNRREKQRYDS